MTKKWIGLYGILCITLLFLVSCAASVPGSGEITAADLPNNQTAAEVPQPAVTEKPALTATPAGLDLNMLHAVPTTYDYLVANPDEFIQSPDPITERAAFDKWFMEMLVPALGPVADRPLNMYTYGAGDSITGFDVCNKYGTELSFEGELTFFYFVYSGAIYPVLCFNGDLSIRPGVTDFTYCPILMVGPMGQDSYFSQLDKISDPDMFFSEMYIYADLSPRPDVHWSETVVNMVKSIGVYDDGNNHIRFGPGMIVMCSRITHRCD